MSRRASILVAVALVALFATTAMAYAYTPTPLYTSVDCLECHQVTQQAPVHRVDFAATVDMTKCKKCHSLAGHWSHNVGYCSSCHDGMPAVLALPYSAVANTAYGYFASATSPAADAVTLHSIHTNGSYPKTIIGRGGINCGNCHAAAACDACHTAPTAHASHAATDYPGVSYQQTRGATVAYSATDYRFTATTTCVNASCHALANVNTSAFVPTCVSCHAGKDASHGYDETQHTATVGSTLDVSGKACADCHQMALFTEHQRTSSSSQAASCAACHPTPRSTFTAWGKTCQQGGCHPAGTATAPHAGVTGAHTPLAVGDAAVCITCHSAGDLAAIHAEATSTVDPAKTSCLVCHSNTSVPSTADCTTCHFTYANHPYPATRHQSTSTLANCGNAGCHTTTDLLAVHKEKNADYTCGDCHGSTRAAVISAIANGKTACTDCHSDVSETVGHRGQHLASPVLWDGTNAYYAWRTGSAAGGAYTDECFGCHTSNLMDEHLGSVDPSTGIPTNPGRYDDEGNALTCGSCHDQLPGTLVADAITAKVTKCDACHVVHDQISITHTSSYTASPAVPCEPCHNAQIADLHNGGISTTTPSGKVLQACNLCHANYESPRGPVVQAAITAHDTDCTACHDAAHPDKGGHSATSEASLECGKCHAKGASEIDIRTVHATAGLGACKVCHENPDRVASITAKSAECSSCHSSGQFHTGLPAKHTNSAMSGNCLGAQCHVATLPEAHAAYVASQTVYATTCDLCHLNADSSRIPANATAACDSCHTVHGTPDHTANASSSCVACHETGDVLLLHKKADGTTDCALCHDNPTRVATLPATADCANCHEKTPLDTKHYASASHTATDSAEYGYACSVCHKLAMDPEHLKASSGSVTCVQCHETKVDAFTTPWDQTCAKCHTVRHADKTAKHASSTTSCSGANCHDITDVETLHSSATTTVAGVTYTACRVCHRDDATVPVTTTCTDCHAGHGDLTAKHTSTASAACVACHETAGVMDLHKKADGTTDCALCHDNPTRVATLPATADCANCHDKTPLDTKHYASASHTAADSTEYGYACSVCHKLAMDPEHLKASSGSVTCVQCHETKVDAFTTPWDQTCARCHTVRHADKTAKHASSTTSCSGANCHDITDVETLHSSATTTVAGVTYTACRVCHRDDATVPVTTTCTDCHAGHGDLTAKHTPTASAACVACHETAAVMDLHKKADGATDCALCHDNPTRVATLPATADCANCHVKTPLDTKHYASASHTATDGAEDGYACSACHSLEMQGAHSAAAVTCVQCHETKVDTFTTAWDKTCASCHTTRHTNKATAHASTKTACSGASCHAISDVSVLHAGAPKKCATCHAAGTTPTADCGAAGCHPTVTGDHESAHDTAGIIDSGCYGCHYQFLTKEHTALGYTCATCHSSTNSAVVAAISSGNIACSGCHPAVNGKDRHANQNANEFVVGNSSGHRVNSTLSAMRSSFVVGGQTYTWPLPTSFLKTGWSTSSIVSCDDCHTFSSAAAGPHGAAVTVNMDPAYSSSWKLAKLGSTSSTIICSKCHSSYSSMNDVHNEGDHSGELCIACHTKLPHGWRLPRMLAYTSDPSTYSSTKLAGISLSNHTPGSGWDESDCAASCDDHSSSMSAKWPSTVQTFGSVSGTVKDASGAVLSGVTVSAGGVSATTGSSGTYTLGGISTGSVTVTAAKSGYATATKTVTVLNNTSVTADFALSIQVVATNLALNKPCTASSTYTSTYSAAKAVDGSLATYWRPSYTRNQWLRVDLGSTKSVSKVVVDWYSSYYARAYQIQTSTDGSNFTTVASVSYNSSGIKTHTFSAVNARYVRLYCTSSYQSSYRLLEFEVWDF